MAENAIVIMGPGAPDALATVACRLDAEVIVLGPDAAEVHLTTERADEFLGHLTATNLDVANIPLEGRRKKLLMADMDSTIIAEESLDVLAAHYGFGAQVSAITHKAMRGEIDFETALKTRVSLLKGLRIDEASGVLIDSMTINPGAEILVKTMLAHGAQAALVTGGFDMFAAPVAEKVGFPEVYANRLRSMDFLFTGEVAEPILGQEAKTERLHALCEEYGLAPSEVIAVGDGANDRGMIEAAGMGVGYRPKPVLTEVSDVVLNHMDLTGLLYLQGFKKDEFIEV